MRTQNKTALFFVLSAIMLFVLAGVGCDNDNGTEPKKNNSIFGSWQLVHVVLKDTPVGDMKLSADLFLEMSETGAKTSTMQFNEDGSASLITTYDDKENDVVPGTWSMDGDKLIIGGAGLDDTVGYDVDDNTLTLTMVMPIDFDSDGTPEDIEIDMVYTRL
jgi:hypothetical protein